MAAPCALMLQSTPVKSEASPAPGHIGPLTSDAPRWEPGRMSPANSTTTSVRTHTATHLNDMIMGAIGDPWPS